MLKIGAVSRIILIQVGVTVVISLLMLLLKGTAAAVSALAGGSIGFLTGLVYAKKMQVSPGSDAKKIIHAHYGAEGYKLIFTILLFALVFTQFKEVDALMLFVAYASTLVVYWIALIIV